MERLLLKPTEVAEALGIGRTRAYEMISSGELPAVIVGRRRRVPADALKRWIRGRQIPSRLHPRRRHYGNKD